MVTVCLLAKTLCLLTQTLESRVASAHVHAVSPAHMYMCILYSVTYACANAVMQVNRADNAAPDLLCRLIPYAKDFSLCVSSVSHY